MKAGPRLGARFRKDENGVAAIEFGVLALPFFITIFALLEIGIIFAGELTLDNAVDRIGRDLRTGQVQAEAPSREEFAEMVCEKVYFLLDCEKLDIDVSVYDTYADIPSGPPMKNGAVDRAALGYDLGGGGRIMAVSVYYDWPILTHILRSSAGGENTDHLMSGMAVFQTETF